MKTFTAQVINTNVLTPTVKSIQLRIFGWPKHIPGQYVSVRIISPEGYVAERDYSIASPPDKQFVELVVELIPTGEVSPILHKLIVGKEVKIQGPRGTHFNWSDTQKPLFLISGGTGIVPFLSMLRYAKAVGNSRQITLLSSFRQKEDVLYLNELNDARAVIHISSTHGRISEQVLQTHIQTLDEDFLISGGTTFVESIRTKLMILGVSEENIKLERFG